MHEFSGSCAPGAADHNVRFDTFSVGIYEMVPARGQEMRRGKVKVRVIGSCDNPDAVYEMARTICGLLDEGRYSGQKKVRV